jgi:CheY-like chemotaxis protein
VQIAAAGIRTFGARGVHGSQPEVALPDIGMLNMSGYEVADRIHATESGTDAILIATTGCGQQEDQRQFLSAGFDRQLTKSIDIDTLTALPEKCANQ